MNIHALHLEEQRLLSKVYSVTGLMEEKHEQLRQLGVFEEYGNVFQAYAQIIGTGEQGTEALKRAVFLGWYEFATPACFTGLFDLPRETTRIVLEALEERIRADEIDFEMRWMLPYYNYIIDLPFSLYPELTGLNTFLQVSGIGQWEAGCQRACKNVEK